MSSYPTPTLALSSPEWRFSPAPSLLVTVRKLGGVKFGRHIGRTEERIGLALELARSQMQTTGTKAEMLAALVMVC